MQYEKLESKRFYIDSSQHQLTAMIDRNVARTTQLFILQNRWMQCHT